MPCRQPDRQPTRADVAAQAAKFIGKTHRESFERRHTNDHLARVTLVEEWFGLDRRTLKGLVASGLLPAASIGGKAITSYRVRVSEITADVAARLKLAAGGPVFPTGELVYFVASDKRHIKIGWSRSLHGRMKALQASNPRPLRLVAFARGGRDLETAYHLRFAQWRTTGEWFKRSPEIEAEIKRLNEALS